MSDVFLMAWLLMDLIWSMFWLGGCAYLVFWRGHSGWWFLLAIILSSCMGGEKLYQCLKDRVRR